MSAPVNPVTASENVAVNWIGAAFVGSVWMPDWLMITVGAVTS
jgi:hypothetical protein